jgi:histidyl-tRNA synthetase
VSSSKFENWRITQLSQHLSDHMRLYGYQSVDLPIIEAADLFLIKAGDQIINRLFTFERHGQQLALRPEFTAAAAYHYMTEYGDAQPVARWQYSGYIFEDDPNDFAQNHQRYSIGAELIGMQGPIADAEIISMAVQGLIQQNIVNWRLTLGHVGLIRRALEQFGLDTRTEYFLLSHLQALKKRDLGKSFVLEQLDKLLLGAAATGNGSDVEGKFASGASTQQMLDMILDAPQTGAIMGGRTQRDIAQRLLQKRRRATERDQIVAALDTLVEWGTIEATPDDAFEAIAQLITREDNVSQKLLMELKSIIQLIKVSGISIGQIKVQPDLARTWDYYSGIVFELRTVDGSHLGGGGRYDELSKLLGNQQSVPAVGFAYYVDEMIAALPEASGTKLESVIIAVDAKSAIAGVRWASQLRQRGLAVQLIHDDNFTKEISGTVLFANEDTTVRVGETEFTEEQIDMLINEVNRKHS